MGELTFHSEIPDWNDMSLQSQNLSGHDDATDQICLVMNSPLPGSKVEWCYDCDLIVGVVQFTRETVPDHHFYVHHLSVLPSYQQRGIGRRLLERVQAVAQEERLPVLVRNVSREAIRVFVKCGFRRVGGTEADPTLMWSGLPEDTNNDHPPA